MTRRRAALLMLAALAATTGCAKACGKNDAASGSADASRGDGGDGGSDTRGEADAAPYTGPLEPHLLARLGGFFEGRLITTRARDRVVYDPGLLPYEVTSGELRAIGTPAAHAPLSDVTADDDLGGYGAPLGMRRQLRFGTKGELVAVHGIDKYVWSGAAWTKSTEVELEEEPRTDYEETRAEIERVDVHGLPVPPPTLLGVSYAAGQMAAARQGADGLEFFVGLRLDVQKPAEAISNVQQVVRTKSGESFVVAMESHGPRVLVHLRKPRPGRVEPPPVYLGTEVDQRVEVLSTMPLRRWVGRCTHVFLVATREKADGAFSSDALFTREAELEAFTIATVKEGRRKKPAAGAPDVALVEGRLGGKRVAGILVWRSFPEAGEELMESLATALGKKLEASPASPVEAYCTLPVLTRAKELRTVPNADRGY